MPAVTLGGHECLTPMRVIHIKMRDRVDEQIALVIEAIAITDAHRARQWGCDDDEEKRLERERSAITRTVMQRGQLGLGCNDVIDTDWGRR